MSHRQKALLKIIVLGDSNVGKTSVLTQYVKNKFSEKFKATIGADFLPKDVMLDDKMVQLQIWDTAGQERYQSLGLSFFRGADALVIVFDVTNKKSFGSLDSWKENFLHARDPAEPEKFPIIVLGNKIDMVDQRRVSRENAEEWCKKEGISPSEYFEVSAKENTNIAQAFQAVAKLAIARGATEDSYFDPGVIDIHEKDKKADSGCC
jgi:Ras-related protein Rab-7A